MRPGPKSVVAGHAEHILGKPFNFVSQEPRIVVWGYRAIFIKAGLIGLLASSLRNPVKLSKFSGVSSAPFSWPSTAKSVNLIVPSREKAMYFSLKAPKGPPPASFKTEIKSSREMWGFRGVCWEHVWWKVSTSKRNELEKIWKKKRNKGKGKEQGKLEKGKKRRKERRKEGRKEGRKERINK